MQGHMIVTDLMGGDFHVAIVDDIRFNQIWRVWNDNNAIWTKSQRIEYVQHLTMAFDRAYEDEKDQWPAHLPRVREGNIIAHYWCQELVREETRNDFTIKNIVFVRA